MALRLFDRLTELLANGPNAREPWLDDTAEQLQGALTSVFSEAGENGQAIKDFLHGTWLGHALHPALILLPAGSWTTAAILDVVGDRQGADTAIGFGILTSLPTAASGLADWSYTSGRSRRIGLVHAILNSAALTCYSLSWLARRGGSRGLGVTLSTVGWGTLVVAAYLGGELSYALGQGVNRIAWSPDVSGESEQLDDFKPVVKLDDVREGRLTGAELDVDGKKVPLVLTKHGREVLALNGVCSHLGGPLAEGKLVDEWCVECPWHGSRFDFRDGEVVRGPAAYHQPKYEVRVRDGMVEARLARPAGDVANQILTSL
jgi:nitrite reductase/ring-hydroxylating ferredoxin subunit